MQTQTRNMAQMDDGEMFHTILDAQFSLMGDMLGQMTATAEPYFPLGAAEAVWLQVLVASALACICIYSWRNLTHLGTLLGRPDREVAAPDATVTLGHRKASTVASRAGELFLNLVGALVGCYALISAFIGILNIYAWVFMAIGG